MPELYIASHRSSAVTSRPRSAGRAGQERLVAVVRPANRDHAPPCSAAPAALQRGQAQWREIGAELTGRSRGTVDYEVALEPVDDYSLDWWFRSVADGAELAWP